MSDQIFDSSRYKIHTFSLQPALQNNNNPNHNDLTEEQVENVYIDFQKLFATEDNPDRVWADDDVSDKKENFQLGLHRDKGVYVLVEDTTTQKIVGLSDMTYEQGLDENTGAYLGFAYVLPNHRRRGIYTEMVRKRVEAAHTLGYPELFADPIDDRKAFSILEKERFRINPAGISDLSVKLDLRRHGVENPQSLK